MPLVRPALIVAVAAAASRLLGFARDVLIAALLGAGPVADAFLVALKLPNLMRKILGEGGLNAGFIPLYARLKRERDAAAARRFAAEAGVALGIVLLVVLAAAEIGAGLVVYLFAAGLADEPATFAMATSFTRLVLPFVVVISLASLGAALLNAEHRFAASAIAPALVNALLIVAFLVIRAATDDVYDTAVFMCLALTVAGALQLALIAIAVARLPSPLHEPSLQERKPRLTFRMLADVKRLALLGLPALVASGTAQLVLVAAVQAASTMPSAVSWLYYADRVFQLPLSFVGVAAGTVLLPGLAAAAQQRSATQRHPLNGPLEATLALALPAAVALVVLATPLSRVLFERGAFGPDDTAGTAAALAGFAVGLPFGVAGKVFASAFFVRESLRVPLAAGLAAILVTLGGAFALIDSAGVGGVALAASAGFAVQASMMAAALWHTGLWRPDRLLGTRLVKLAAASLAMGLVVYGLGHVLEPAFAHPHFGMRWAALLGLCFSGMGVYLALVFALKAVSRRDLAAALSG